MTIQGIHLAVAAAAALLSAAGQVKTTAPRPQVVTTLNPLTVTAGATASPSTINFTLSDPDAAAVTGTGTVQWQTIQGKNAKTWTLGVSSTGGSCGDVPLTAVTAQCTSVTVPGGSSETCSASKVTLTGAAQQIASGRETATINQNYSVGVTFSIQDAWAYKGHTTTPCTIPITYTITVP
jgi:hypothetical protein